MGNFYILVAADVSDSRLHLPSAHDVAKYRLSRGEWGLNNRTWYRKKIDIGDRVVIYVSGRRDHRQSFIGSAEVASKAKKTTLEERLKIDAPDEKGSMLPPFSIRLSNTQIFKNYVAIREYVNHLSFIKKPETWWIYMQGGVLKINADDFHLITSAGLT